MLSPPSLGPSRGSEHDAQIWERRTEKPVELRVENALPPAKIKTTRSIVAATADKTEAKGPQQVVKSQVGVKMGKVRVEKGDSRASSRYSTLESRMNLSHRRLHLVDMRR